VAEIMQGEPLPDFGARGPTSTSSGSTSRPPSSPLLVKREGLVFSPNPDLPTILLETLERVELRIAEVRAAVQE
jgi:hypothetical protein